MINLTKFDLQAKRNDRSILLSDIFSLSFSRLTHLNLLKQNIDHLADEKQWPKQNQYVEKNINIPNDLNAKDEQFCPLMMRERTMISTKLRRVPMLDDLSIHRMASDIEELDFHVNQVWY